MQNDKHINNDEQELFAEENDLELFSEELEDRFNADTASSAGTLSSAGGTFASWSTYCSGF